MDGQEERPIKKARVILSAAGVFLAVGVLWVPAASAEEGGAALWPMDIPEKVGEIPTDPVEFYRWVIVDRARSSLKRVQDSEDGLIYGAASEDANVAWIFACASPARPLDARRTVDTALLRTLTRLNIRRTRTASIHRCPRFCPGQSGFLSPAHPPAGARASGSCPAPRRASATRRRAGPECGTPPA